MTDINVRWMLKRDLPEVLNIENQSFEFSWSEDDIIRSLRQRNIIGIVCEDTEFYDSLIKGFMIHELHKNKLHMLNFAVHPDYRRQGIGSHLINKLIDKLNPRRRIKILLEVRETNLPAQLFFRSRGFKAISVLRDFYDDTTEDAYLMEYKLRSEEDSKYSPSNRISNYLRNTS